MLHFKIFRSILSRNLNLNISAFGIRRRNILVLSYNNTFILLSIRNICLHILIASSHFATTIRSTDKLKMFFSRLRFLRIFQIAYLFFVWSTISSNHFYIRAFGWYDYVCWFFIRRWRFDWLSKVRVIIGILRMIKEVLLLMWSLRSCLHFIIIIIPEIKLLSWCIVIYHYFHLLSLFFAS